MAISDDDLLVDSDRSPGSLSASDSEEEDEDDHATALRLQELHARVSASNSYEDHVNYIDALRQAAELEKLRVAREAMNAVFPLTPTMWLEWCEDESRLATSHAGVPAVEVLYERGVQEYLAGISKMRALFERALTSTGLHFTEGGKVWEAFRDYEAALLLSMAESSPEAKANQVEALRSLFHRQLRIPLADHTQTLEQYKDWELEQGVHIGTENDELAGLPGGVSSAYKTADQMSKARVMYESNIVAGKPVDGDLLQHCLVSHDNMESNMGYGDEGLMSDPSTRDTPDTPQEEFLQDAQELDEIKGMNADENKNTLEEERVSDDEVLDLKSGSPHVESPEDFNPPDEMNDLNVDGPEHDLEVLGDGEGVEKSFDSEKVVAPFPISRVKRIIKLDKDVRLVTSDAIALVAQATALFVQTLSSASFTVMLRTKRKTIRGSDVVLAAKSTRQFRECLGNDLATLLEESNQDTAHGEDGPGEKDHGTSDESLRTRPQHQKSVKKHQLAAPPGSRPITNFFKA